MVEPWPVRPRHGLALHVARTVVEKLDAPASHEGMAAGRRAVEARGAGLRYDHATRRAVRADAVQHIQVGAMVRHHAFVILLYDELAIADRGLDCHASVWPHAKERLVNDGRAEHFDGQLAADHEDRVARIGHPAIAKRRVRINAARVGGKDKAKTGKSRDVELCPRAFAILMRQRAVSQLKGAEVFVRDDGEPWTDLQRQLKQWDATFKRLPIRRRVPY